MGKRVTFADTAAARDTDDTSRDDDDTNTVETAAASNQTADNEELSMATTTVSIGNNTDDSTATVRTTSFHGSEERQRRRRQRTTVQERAAQRLANLDAEFDRLDRCEILLVEEYARIVEEEARLRRALQKSTESGRETRLREKREKDESAVQRLEAALFDDDGEDSTVDTRATGSMDRGSFLSIDI